MSLKKLKVISFFIVFIISFLCHFMYEWIPNFVTSIFFPVNESIWEHMKIFFTAILISGLIESFIIKKCKIQCNNHLFEVVLSSVISIPIYLIIYLPLYKIFGEVMFISIGLMVLVYVFLAFVQYKFLIYRDLKVNKYILISVVIMGYVILGYLTYNPIHSYLFFDIIKKKYGI